MYSQRIDAFSRGTSGSLYQTGLERLQPRRLVPLDQPRPHRL